MNPSWSLWEDTQHTLLTYHLSFKFWLIRWVSCRDFFFFICCCCGDSMALCITRCLPCSVHHPLTVGGKGNLRKSWIWVLFEEDEEWEGKGKPCAEALPRCREGRSAPGSTWENSPEGTLWKCVLGPVPCCHIPDANVVTKMGNWGPHHASLTSSAAPVPLTAWDTPLLWEIQKKSCLGTESRPAAFSLSC